MLMLSKRYSAADLEHWKRMEAYDAVLARSPVLERKEQQALDAVAAFMAGGPGYASTSWGKDSTVMAHLVHRTDPTYPLVWVRMKNWENPDCLLVRDAFLKAHPMSRYDEIEIDVGAVRVSGQMEAGFDEAAKRWGPRHASGVRAQESMVRRQTIGKNGLVSRNTARPIGYWDGTDVFAYLHKHRLPVHPAYACNMNGIKDRVWLRVASLGGERGQDRGREDWERHYYRAEFVVLDRMVAEARNASA